MHHEIVIIGAGTAGITVAAQLFRENKELDVAIIDPATKHYYQPAWTLVGAGTYKYKDTEREMSSVMPKQAKWIQDSVTDINPEEHTVTTKGGDTIGYHFLIVCPGIQINLDAIPGLKETFGKNNISSVYVNPEYTWETLQNFKGGKAVFTQAATPIKCGGAPQKVMYLADDYLRKSGVRDKTTITFPIPGSVIFGVDPFKDTLMEVVKRKDLHLRFFHKLTKIDGDKKLAYYQITKHAGEPELLFHNKKEIGEEWISEEEVAIPFDLLHLAPPQSAPDFIQQSKLVHKEGPNKGWINVNINTLQHNDYYNIFALGDSAALPTAKTGAAIRKQAPVVVENLLYAMEHEDEVKASYHGYSSCPLVTGYGKMVLAEFKYQNVRDSDPLISRFIDTSKEQYSMWILKKYGLPFMYWNLMLRGRA